MADFIVAMNYSDFGLIRNFKKSNLKLKKFDLFRTLSSLYHNIQPPSLNFSIVELK